MLKFLLPLLLSSNVFASTLVVQSYDITAIYGDSIASYYGRSTLYKIRNVYLDKYDNRKHILDRVLQKSKEFDNLIVLGFDVGPYNKLVFDAPYREFVKNSIKEFYPTKDIHVLCNSLCLNVGTIHRVNNTRELRKLLLTLEGVVVNSLTFVWDEDRHRNIRGDEITRIFLTSDQFLVSALYRDNNTHMQFWIEAGDVYNGSLKPNARIKLKKIQKLPDVESLINTAIKLKMKAK